MSRGSPTSHGSRRPRLRGGWLRREQESGVGALTASELRVARRAGEGLANREIAQGLFVTVKTVEKHLAGAYRKLGCSRAELAGTLGDGDRQARKRQKSRGDPH